MALRFDPTDPNDLITRFCFLEGGEGKGEILTLELNDVESNFQRHRARIKEPFQRHFEAVLSVVEDQEVLKKYFSSASKEGEVDFVLPMPPRPEKPPEKVKVLFRTTSFNFHRVVFYCKEGSSELSDEQFNLFFELEWKDLVSRDTIMMTIPWKGGCPEDRGNWRIELFRIK